MPVKDPFSYSDRWDSVGLDCSNCTYFGGPDTWPDTKRTLHCRLHDVSLAVEIGPTGYKEGEWFCKDFSSNGTPNANALAELNNAKRNLEGGKLYGAYGNDGFLKEIPFSSLHPKGT